MYVMNTEGLKLLELFKSKAVAETIGVNVITISNIKKHSKACNKQTAYCLTKFLDRNAEIDKFFNKATNGKQ